MSNSSADCGALVGGDRRTLVSALLVVVVVVGVTLGLWKADVRADTGLPVGAHDFVAYWTAFDLGVDGGDPYDFEELRSAQVEISSRYEPGPQRFWNPPWALVVMGPVLLLPFELAASAWLVLQVVGGLAAAALSWRLFRPDGPAPPPAVLAVGVLFVPFFDGLKLGQMGVYVAVCLLGAFVALREDRDVVAGLLLALLVVKPQTVLLPLLLIGVHVLTTRRWTVVWSSIAGTVSMIVASVIAFPSVWAGWDPLGGSPTHWHSATFAGWLRESLPVGADGPPTWPILVVPFVALAVTLPWALRHARELPWSDLPGLLAISVLCAPYAWVSDSMVLVPIHVFAFAGLVEGRRRRIGIAAFAAAAQIGALLLRSQDWSGQHHMVVVPAAMLVLHLLVRRADGYLPPQVNLDRALQVVAELEDDELIRKMRAGR